MQLIFEPASGADAETLVRIQIAAFHHDSVLYPEIAQGGPPGYDSIEQMRKNIAQHPCYKLAYEGRPIGVMVVFDQGDGHIHLDGIAIDPSYGCAGSSPTSPASPSPHESTRPRVQTTSLKRLARWSPYLTPSTVTCGPMGSRETCSIS